MSDLGHSCNRVFGLDLTPTNLADDFHHRRTHANYQTLFFYWDWLVGGFGDFWEWRKRRWDPAQWKDGVGFVNKVDRDRDGTEPIGEDTMATLEKSNVKKVK